MQLLVQAILNAALSGFKHLNLDIIILHALPKFATLRDNQLSPSCPLIRTFLGLHVIKLCAQHAVKQSCCLYKILLATYPCFSTCAILLSMGDVFEIKVSMHITSERTHSLQHWAVCWWGQICIGCSRVKESIWSHWNLRFPHQKWCHCHKICLTVHPKTTNEALKTWPLHLSCISIIDLFKKLDRSYIVTVYSKLFHTYERAVVLSGK